MKVAAQETNDASTTTSSTRRSYSRSRRVLPMLVVFCFLGLSYKQSHAIIKTYSRQFHEAQESIYGTVVVKASASVSPVSVSVLSAASPALVRLGSGKSSDGNEAKCESNGFVSSMLLGDKVLPQTTTHMATREIPKVIHFIVQSKCLPEELAKSHSEAWEGAVQNYSIMYYDQDYIDNYMAQEHKDFPAAASKYKCATDPMARMDIAKLMILWDKGGISVDFGNIPGPAFGNGETDLISDTDECVFEVDGEWKANPRFLACKPRHAAVYSAITHFLAMAFVGSIPAYPYHGASGTFGIMAGYMTGPDEGHVKTLRIQKDAGSFDNHTIVQINTNRTEGDILTSLTIRNDTLEDLIRLQRASKEVQDECDLVMRNDSFEVDIDSLLDLVGFGKENTSCPEGLTYVGSRHNASASKSIIQGRKIPKIVHKTSKTRCFAENYVPAMNMWRFEDHSFFVHDDEAVDKLLNREWPEFPLLQHARSCTASGAGMAGKYMYLVQV